MCVFTYMNIYLYLCVCVCVCEREREGDRESVFSNCSDHLSFYI